MRKTELRYLPAKELRIATAADGTKTLSGYAIVFGVRSLNLGGFVEIVESRAVTDTLSGKPDILLLNNHNSSEVLARSTSNTLKLSTDAVGVRFSCSLDTRSTYANDLAIAVERGDIRGCSFGFETLQDAWSNENGTLLRSLQKINVSEISICSSPAYPQTAVSVRSCPSDLRTLLKRDLGDDWDDDDDEDDECDCDCPECLLGNHAECTGEDGDCDFDFDDDGEDSIRSLSLWRLKTQIAIALRR